MGGGRQGEGRGGEGKEKRQEGGRQREGKRGDIQVQLAVRSNKHHNMYGQNIIMKWSRASQHWNKKLNCKRASSLPYC